LGLIDTNENKIGLFSLVGIIISGIVGAGIFNLMKEMASTASAGVTLIGWLIAGVGMGSLAMCMIHLNHSRPDLNAGIFSYAQVGFGDYVGFNSVWGYWISIIIGNVAFGTLLFSSLGYFFPIFGNGQNIPSIIGASVVLWIIFFIITRGLKKATMINTMVMIAKSIPILIFIVCVIGGFDKNIFVSDFWGARGGGTTHSILEQLKGTVLVTVWVFIGIEGAVVFSGRAKKRSDVGKATFLGFLSVILIYSITTVFSFGIMSQEELSHLQNPAMAYVLERIIGKTGATIVNIGVIISVTGAWISNTMLAEEVAFQAGKNKLFPTFFVKENKHLMPANSIGVTCLIVQLLLLSFLVTDNAYSLLSKLSSSTILLPYTCVALFQLKECFIAKTAVSLSNYIVGVIASIYMFWLIYASGMTYLLLTILALFPGTLLYIYVKKKNHVGLFKPYEQIMCLVLLVVFVYGLLNIGELLQG